MQHRTFKDQLGRIISVPYPPQWIISLVPSQTELLFDLGLDQEIIGITKFCIRPSVKFKSITKIGGTKTLNLQKIRELKPDLIIGNKEENEQSQIEELMKEFPVWMSDIHALDDAIEMINLIGRLTAKEKKAQLLASEIKTGFESIKSADRKRLRAAYFIWKDPYMIAGRNTFIDDILKRAGFDNVSNLTRYPEITTEQVGEAQPDVILLSSEPYPFKDVHVKEMQSVCPHAKVMIVDGELFSWYGSRLLRTPSYLTSLREELKPMYRNI